ncbi:AvrE-family type 3 secretion system effector [Billgrantia tianxiuensis]|uniref:AvrE-family type 3 secretion system effector n=3 Tax=Halomonadaceae TaxID=28256 RepID=A0A6I6SQQ0_9GAMM|nr:AvrE-family type 3 secretion system effector [Halomonas tianxiuensis]
MTKIQGSALQSTQESQEVSRHATGQGIRQVQGEQRHGRVQSLASDGRELPLPEAVTQQTADAEGHTVGKHKKKPLSLKNLLGIGRRKPPSSSLPGSGQRQSTGNGSPSVSAGVNLPADTLSRERAGQRDRHRSRSMASRLMHQLGMKQHKAEKNATPGTAAEAQRPTTHSSLPPGFASNSLLARVREDNPQGFSHLDKNANHPTGESSRPLADAGGETSRQEEDPEVSAHLQALRQRGLSAFTLPTIPEGDESEVDGSGGDPSLREENPQVDASRPATGQFPDGRSANELHAERGKAPLFTPSHSIIEIGASSTTAARRPPSPPPGPSSSQPAPPTGASQESTVVLQPPRLGVKDSKLTIDPETPASVATLIKETLGKASQSYVAHESREDDRQQYLLDGKGRAFQVSTDPQTGLVALHSSKTMLDPKQPPASIADRLADDGHPVGERNYLALITGVHHDGNGDRWRLHDDKLHKLSSAGQWQPDRPDIDKLTPGGDGGLYGLEASTRIVDLATGRSSITTEQPIAAFDINRHGEVAQLLEPASGRDNILRLLPSLEASPEQALELIPRYAPDTPIPGLKSSDVLKLGHIAITDQALFATDKENRLLMAPLPQQGQTELHFQAIPQSDLENAFGKDIQFEGFTPHGDGKLSALIRDHGNQLHACPLDDSGTTFRPGWNLSDVLHIDNSRGIAPEAPQGLTPQDFGKLGQLGLADGKLYAKDKLTEQWTQVGGNIDGLHRGLDGQPYVLQEGKLKKVAFKENSAVIAHGDSNVSAITQTRGQPELKDGPKNTPKENITAAAVLDNYRHVTLSESGELRYTHVRPGTNSDKHPPVIIGTRGLEGEIRQLSVDRNERLFALTSEGKLYSLAADDWQKPRFTAPSASWQPETLPEGTGDLTGATLSGSSDYRGELTLASGERLKRQEHGWESSAPPEQENASPANDKSGRDRLFDNLALASKGFKVSKGGVKYAATAQFGGVAGMETHKISSRFLDRLSAHVFKPSWETPRPIKTAANFVQHRWQGREGLRPLYEQESALFKELEARNTEIKSGLAPQRERVDLKTRVQRLELGSAGAELKEELESLRESLELSAEKRLTELGKHQGVLNRGGELKLDYKPSQWKDIVQTFNPNRSGHSLCEELLTLWKHSPASPDSNTAQLLRTFTALGVNMSHQQADIPLGRQRDYNDAMALGKARLVLDTLALVRLDRLVEKAELVSGDQATPQQLASLKHDLAQLRDNGYENNRVKHYTDHGMLSHKDVEARYDVAKTFIKAFSDSGHGVSLISRAAMQSKDQQALNQDMKALLHSLKPDDDVIISRAYGAGASATFIPAPLAEKVKVLDMFPSVGAEQKRNYNIEFLGTEDGIEVTLSRNLGLAGSGNMGISKDVLPDILKRDPKDIPVSINGGEQTFKPDLVLGAGLTVGGGAVSHDEFIFNIRGKEIDDFVDGLTSGRITPEALVDKGVEHVSMHGKKTFFSVDLGANFTARARLDLTDKDDNPTAMFRLGGGISGGMNLFSRKKDELHYQGIEKSKHRINNTTGPLNSGSASADLALTFGINRSENEGDLVMFSNAKSEGKLAVDNSVKVRGEIQTKRAEPVTGEDLDSLIDSLAKAFHDPISQEMLKNIGELTDIGEQLSILKTHFLSSGTVPHQNDKQYAALRSIESTAVQHQAASANKELMSTAKAVVAHSNPSHLDRGGVLNFLTSLVAPSRKDALASQINGMMKTDPAFAAIIDGARSKPNSYTWVTLEPKDDVRHRLEENYLEGKTGLAEVKAALENPQSRRIKSITLYETGQHNEGFSSPTLLFGGSSSANIYMERVAGTISFQYGADQDTPRSYTLSGNAVSSKPEVASAMTELKQQGLDVRS